LTLREGGSASERQAADGRAVVLAELCVTLPRRARTPLSAFTAGPTETGSPGHSLAMVGVTPHPDRGEGCGARQG
jgi:hypothetical protein